MAAECKCTIRLFFRCICFIMKFLSFAFGIYAKYRYSYNIYRTSECLFHFCKIKRYVFLPPVTSSSLHITILNKVNLHTTSTNCAKHFLEKENEYAHNVLENIPFYSKSVLKHPLTMQTIDSFKISDSVHDAVNDFVNVTLQNLPSKISLEDTRFLGLVADLSDVLPIVSDDDIVKILHVLCLWPPTPKTFTPNFKLLWNNLDNECVKRLKRWDISRKLLVADYWFHLRLSRISQYNKEFIANLLENVNSLSNSELVQLMFYINLQRDVPESLLGGLESKLKAVMDFISLEELGVICLAFFKTRNKMSDFSVVKSVIKQCFRKLECVDTVTVAAILKFLRKSFHPSLIDSYIPLMHKCVTCIPKFDIPTSVHLALLSSETNVYHPLLLNAVTDKLFNEYQDTRIKDCMKLLQSLSHFNHYEESKFHEKFLIDMQSESRQHEIMSHPHSFIYSLLYYAYMGHFNYTLLQKALHEGFYHHSCSVRPETAAAFAYLDYCIEIECPDYEGPRLEKNALKVLNNRRGNMPYACDDPNLQTRLISDCAESLISILESEDNVLIRHILPHFFTPDIVIRLPTSGSQSLSDLYGNYPANSILVPPSNEVWAAFVICGVNCFAYKSKHINGLVSMKLRQLEKIGYKVVLIPFYELSKNKTHRKNYLKEKLEMLKKDFNCDNRPFVCERHKAV